MFNHYRYKYFPFKLYIAPIPIIYPNNNYYKYNNRYKYYDFSCYKLIKDFCYY